MDHAHALVPSRLARWFSSEWLRPLNDWAAIEDLLSPLNTTWSATRVRARVTAKRQEARDTVTLALAPNARWPGFDAGQHAVVEVEINGRILRRRYSMTSLPGRRDEIRFTVKRHPQGKVSNWLHDQVQPGDILTIGAPEGDFFLPATPVGPMLLIGAGSGMTPVWSMLAELEQRQQVQDVVLLQICHSAEDVLFSKELQRMAEAYPGLRLLTLHTATSGRPDAASITALVPDYATRQTYICGPEGLMGAVRSHWEAAGLAAQLFWERFGVATAPAADAQRVAVSCAASNTHFQALTGTPLLSQVEQAGLSPRYGCRTGICHSCRYHKRSGTVKNLLTGEVSAEPDELIQLCISAACTDVQFKDL